MVRKYLRLQHLRIPIAGVWLTVTLRTGVDMPTHRELDASTKGTRCTVYRLKAVVGKIPPWGERPNTRPNRVLEIITTWTQRECI